MMRILVCGGTDLTAAVAAAIVATPMIELAGIVEAPAQFDISYRPEGVKNTRHADLRPVAESARVPHRAYDAPSVISDLAIQTSAEVGLAVGWYHMIGSSIRDAFPRGVLGFHASLLPDLRGGAPLPWSILSGRRRTGVTLFVLDDGVDTGPVIAQREFPIGPRDTVAHLIGRAEEATVELTEQALPGFANGELLPRDQGGVPSYGLQRGPEDGGVDWTRSAQEIDALVRAVTRPYPGAYTYLDGTKITIWETLPTDEPVVLGSPGQIGRIPEHSDPVVVTGNGLVLVRAATDDKGDAIDRLKRSAHRQFRDAP